MILLLHFVIRMSRYEQVSCLVTNNGWKRATDNLQ